MTSMNTSSKRMMLASLFVASMLGGCAYYGPVPSGYYTVNADGSRTYVAGTYTCPAGYNCDATNNTVTQQVYSDSDTTPYYAYPTGYIDPAYVWPPLFFGLGYGLGYYGGYGYYPYWGYYRGGYGYHPHRRYYRGGYRSHTGSGVRSSTRTGGGSGSGSTRR